MLGPPGKTGVFIPNAGSQFVAIDLVLCTKSLRIAVTVVELGEANSVVDFKGNFAALVGFF